MNPRPIKERVKIHVELQVTQDGNVLSLQRNENSENEIKLSSLFGIDCPKCDHYFDTELIVHGNGRGNDDNSFSHERDIERLLSGELNVSTVRTKPSIAGSISGAATVSVDSSAIEGLSAASTISIIKSNSSTTTLTSGASKIVPASATEPVIYLATEGPSTEATVSNTRLNTSSLEPSQSVLDNRFICHHCSKSYRHICLV